MKNLQNLESRCSLTTKKIYQLLLKANRLIHCPIHREAGNEIISQIEAMAINPEERLFCYYLSSRYFYLSYMENEDLEFLEYAHDFLNDLVQFAFDNGIKVTNRMHFMRARVKHILSKSVWEEERVEWLVIKANKIVTHILKKDPYNEEYLELQRQLAA
ncbi:hypothetical protein [Gilvibacter sediminis]|uniref:hypothetical protein n=1 Tax=Gilvibacter sediminis TaxID=379071 RepID=UPI0023504553|nr:hypothetical protein [Gilvibacter sediminis]MDC7996908.1 hypothetical protein [Gilvibacter sediminis]